MPQIYEESVWSWIERVYRIAAEQGDRAVLDAMYERRGTGLRHPDDELNLVRNISRGRAKEALHAQS